MIAALFMLFMAVCLSGAIAGSAGVAACRLAPEKERPAFELWMWKWGIKGLGVPLALWAVFNIGFSWSLPALMPDIQAAQNSGRPWFPAYIRFFSNGALVASTYWAAVTLAWVLYKAGQRTKGQARKDLTGLYLSSGIVMVIIAGLILLVWHWAGMGLAVVAILGPVAAYAPEIINPRKLPPIYARAVAKMKFGKYSEAEWEIIKQLEDYEDDFQGWMMLAGLYAEQFDDLAEAERTILDLCDQPTLNDSQRAVALNRLADWHLKLKDDPEGARRALLMIRKRMPGSHMAHMAQVRMAQLPATLQELRETRTPKPVPLPALGDTLDEHKMPSESERKQAAASANACTARLKQDPNHVPSRERLARLLAEQLGKPEQGIRQLELLLDMPDQPESSRVEWLSLIGAWQFKYRHDQPAGRAVLERLVKEYPETVQAMAARRRIELMDRELRWGRK